MGAVSTGSIRSTIGRTHERLARRRGLWPHGRGARSPHSFRLLTAVRRWVRDPLGIAADLEDWSLDEEDIRADLEYGRD